MAALKERVTKGYPDKEFIRQVYDCLGNYFQIAEGAGDGYAFEFDMADFIRKFKLEQIRTLSALSILQVGGYLECTTEINSKSRICFMVSREQLDEYNFRNHLAEKLLVLLMRKYGGIFVQYMYIGEQYLADELGCKRQEVYDTLLELSRQRIISYIPGNDRPYIVYHRPRLPLSYLTIGKEAYEERKKSYQEKVTEMVRYIEEPDKCRQLSLMRYFGQKETVPCGICDVCLAKRKASRSDRQAIRESILAQLRLHEMEIKELVRIPEASEEEVIVQIRRLLDEALIYYKTPTTLSINEK